MSMLLQLTYIVNGSKQTRGLLRAHRGSPVGAGQNGRESRFVHGWWAGRLSEYYDGFKEILEEEK